MNLTKIFLPALIIATLVVAPSCKDALNEEVFIDVASNSFFQNDADANKAVDALYAKLRSDGRVTGGAGQQEGWGFFAFGESSLYNFNEASTDEVYVKWASSGGFFQTFEQFNFLPNGGAQFDGMFNDIFEGITIANNLLENIETDKISQPIRERVKGEALFARALFYSAAVSLYGNVPLIQNTSSDPFLLAKRGDFTVLVAAIAKDFEDAAALLPASYGAADYGRFTKGAAYAKLARFQLNQKNWQAAVDAARAVVALGKYKIVDDYGSIFSVNNEGNEEIILTIPSLAQPGIGNTFIAHTAEPDFASSSWGGHLIREAFYNGFDPADVRRTYLIKDYTSTTGAAKTIANGAMIVKYQVDPNRIGAWAGNDIVLHRYAEVLLTLAEALNELNGPNAESISLMNDLRKRAFPAQPAKLLSVTDFADKAALRAAILNERGWELYSEGFRREDLIRHGEYISRAVARGAAAMPYHVLFPIPQVELDRNPEFGQNDGYN
jgi:starch-binding outer membrane protein, SusD/RagB family